MAATRKEARASTEPGQAHRVLGRFVGHRTTEARLVLVSRTSVREAGEVRSRWVIPGRSIEGAMRDSLVGGEGEPRLDGHGHFEQGCVATTMARSDGDPLPGASLVTCATMAECLAGEDDERVEYAWRVPSKDEIVPRSTTCQSVRWARRSPKS